jgi:preprotein translocase SecE subunit
MKPIKAVTSYFSGVGAELKKVRWPAASVVAQHSLSVVIGVALFTAFIAAVDIVFLKALTYIINQ